jgi:hypothetical protein
MRTTVCAAAVAKCVRWKGGLAVLLFVQVLVCLVLLGDFLFGTKAFAYFDIGWDSYSTFTPMAMLLADYVRSEGWPGWSFQIGLGHNLALFADPFTLLNAATGSEHVLELRAWVYALKLVLAGVLFHRFGLTIGLGTSVAVATALAYSFCGYALVDGQWDPLATELVAHALLLWSVARQVYKGGWVLLPLSTALAFCVTPFFVSLAVFTVIVAVAHLLATSEPRAATARRWLFEIAPLLAVGILLAAPRLLPIALQLGDLGRVSGLPPYLTDALVPLDTHQLMTQLAGVFHKDVLIPIATTGSGNYLESPGFFVGVLPLLLIPQLWRLGRSERRQLLLATAALAFYLMFPFLRRLAYAFQLDYFRVSTLWVAALLLSLSARALEGVLDRGIDRRLLAGTAAALVALAGAVVWHFGPRVRLTHLLGLGTLTVPALLFLLWQGPALRVRPRVMAALVAFVAIEAVLLGYPPLFQDRRVLSKTFDAYRDGTQRAVAWIRTADQGAYRVDKTYASAGHNDAFVQGYWGVKSYTQQNGATVAFFRDLGLLPASPRLVNSTNWLSGFGERFVLESVVGVRYVISRVPLSRPGYVQVAATDGLRIYRNELALDLGAVHDHVLPRSQFMALPAAAKDVALLRAAVVADDQVPAGMKVLDPAQIARAEADWLVNYSRAARQLQRRGWKVTGHTNRVLAGTVESDSPGLLVVTIPDAPGWSVRVDGKEQPLQRAHLGMMGVSIEAGRHVVELRHRQPGLVAGLLLAGLGILVWLVLRGTRAPAARP